MKEEIRTFGKGDTLVGVVTVPSGRPPHGRHETPRLGVVILNSGWVHHVGPHRMSVRLGRLLAQRGLVAVRFDLSGIGDSRARTDNLPFEEAAIVETREVMDDLEREYGVEGFVVVGNCSGGSVAYRTAVEDPRVVGGALLNVNAYDTSSDTNAYVTQQGLANFYWKRALRDPKRWFKLLTGASSYRRIGQSLKFQAERLLQRDAPLAEVSAKVCSEIRSMLERPARILFVFSEGDAAIDHYRMLVGDRLKDLDGHDNFQTTVIPGADHLFTIRSVQQQLFDRIGGWIDGFADRTLDVEGAKAAATAGEPVAG